MAQPNGNAPSPPPHLPAHGAVDDAVPAIHAGHLKYSGPPLLAGRKIKGPYRRSAEFDEHEMETLRLARRQHLSQNERYRDLAD